MDKSYHDIRRLYLEKLTDTISEEDEARLRELLHRNETARAIWKRLEEERRELNADAVLQRIDPAGELEAWNNKVHGGEKRRLPAGWWRWVAAAAVLLGIGISYFFRNDLADRNRQADASPAGLSQNTAPAGVRLVLGNGKSLVFPDGETETYTIEKMQLQNSGNQLRYKGDAGQAAGMNTLEVPATLNYGITLSDGTRVFLNSKSSLRFPFFFSGDTRNIFVEGEAYLEVAGNTGKPFIVHTPSADIQVVGTRFNVNTYKKGTVRTALVEGSVVLKAPGREPLRLTPGREATYSDTNGFTTASFDADELLSWRKGVFYFRHQQLGDLAGLLGRWFGVQVVFERGHLARHSVSGLIEKGHLPEFLKDLHVTTGINYTLKDTTLYLR